jgi:7,8-dihydropterin-6-yl-methyl-4-(beta-D-ribofuranosyl)aminobenzene 5'-phosphate synthase
MEVTILVDNTALFDRMFVAEHGFSAYLEVEGKRILFDTGYSSAFLENAGKMKIDLLDLDYIVLSHGHFDHTGGLWHLIHWFMEATIEGTPHRLPRLIAHPRCFFPRPKTPIADIGAVLTADEVQRIMPLELSAGPFNITPNLSYLGEIERKFPFEDATPGPRRIVLPDGTLQEDRILDDTSLAFRSRAGLVVITGCAHAGICNTVEYAKKISGESRVHDIIGGLHLRAAGTQLEGTCAYIKTLNPAALHACHCTSLAAKIALAQVTPLHEIGVGLRLEFADR